MQDDERPTDEPSRDSHPTPHPVTDDAPAKQRPRGRRRFRKTKIAAVVLALVFLVGAFTLRTPSPVGHWDSAEGQDQFLSAYEEAFTQMPQVDDTFDVRTDFGVVRFYRFAGSGDAHHPLVLLPGRASASPVWADNMVPLLQIGDVYTVDLLGEPGMSIAERPISTDAEQAQWLHQALIGLPEDQFHLVGLSIGGWNTVNLALHHPETVASMSLLDPVFVFDDMPLGTVIRSIPASLPWLPKSWRDSFNSYTAGGAPVEDEPVAQMIEAGMQHYTLRLPQPTRIEPEGLGALDMPVMAIIAGDSVMLDATAAYQTAVAALPQGTIHLYEGASHAVNGEQPAQVAEDIEAFLANVE